METYGITPSYPHERGDNNDPVGRPSRRAKAAGTLKLQHIQETHTHTSLYVYV